jgi:class 3 adenylate cyclase
MGAERKQVTVLFSDLTGFTALTEKLDPEETRQIVGRIFGCAADVVARYEGRIEKFVGDAIMAIFGVPTAHEDDPVRAVRAALELHETIARLSPQIEARAGVPIAMHSGVNTGVVVTGELQFDHGIAGPLGDTINLAARLMNTAPSGEIWIGPETRHLVEHAFELEDRGAREFKGKSQPVAVARVRATRGRTVDMRRFRGLFVGRQAELGALLGAVEKVRDGEAQVFGICGDAGTGKTRLVSELRAQVGAKVQWLEGRAYPYAQQIPYAPLIDLLSSVWGIEETDSPARVRAKVIAGVSAALDSADDVVPLMLHLYHLEQAEGVVIEREAFQERLLAAIQRLLAALAQRAPTVVCLQDLHWADPSSTTFLRGLVEGLRSPILLLGNYRPGYVPPPGMQVLELRELSPRQTGELLASLLQGEPPAALTRFVAERSDGNPFYIEEVVNSLVETQVLTRSHDGWTLTRSLAQAGVPSTIRGVIAARIDRLDGTRRRVLRHAAVVGREFLYAIVALVTDDAGAVAPSLTQLQAADLIRARRPDPDLEYIFKHALTQDVAYDGLLMAERQVLHARTARAMEAVFSSRIPEFVETIAYHFQRGGVADKAIHYLVEAGKKCVARYALVEATTHFREAYALIADGVRTPQQSRMLAELLVAWSHVHYCDGTIGEWHRQLEKHLVDAERCGDCAVLAIYLGWLGNSRAFHGDMLGSLQVLDRALEVARSAQAHDAIAHVLAWRTYSLLERGRLAEAVQSAQSIEQNEEEMRANPYPYFKGNGGSRWR